jgi:hypothetical protein
VPWEETPANRSVDPMLSASGTVSRRRILAGCGAGRSGRPGTACLPPKGSAPALTDGHTPAWSRLFSLAFISTTFGIEAAAQRLAYAPITSSRSPLVRIGCGTPNYSITASMGTPSMGSTLPTSAIGDGAGACNASRSAISKWPKIERQHERRHEHEQVVVRHTEAPPPAAPASRVAHRATRPPLPPRQARPVAALATAVVTCVACGATDRLNHVGELPGGWSYVTPAGGSRVTVHRRCPTLDTVRSVR